jgi:hypothetical protein
LTIWPLQVFRLGTPGFSPDGLHFLATFFFDTDFAFLLMALPQHHIVVSDTPALLNTTSLPQGAHTNFCPFLSFATMHLLF